MDARFCLGRLARVASALAAASLPAPAAPLGDLNCDGVVNAFDIDPFVLALTDPAGYQVAWPACDLLLGDINQDGAVDAFDIDPFVALLVGGSAPTPAELAGQPLDAYPCFEYVRTINLGAALHVALDPTRWPGIVGQTADLYVVAAQSAAAWAASPDLLDVSGDGPETVTFSPGTIQANTFRVDPGTLSADAGLELGRPYDVVIDFNRNGQLDAGDLLDGGGAEAGFYVLGDLTLPGPLATAWLDYTISIPTGIAEARLGYPAAIGSLGALPLVMIGHGGGQEYTWYDYLQAHLASYGFVTVSHENPFTADFPSINWHVLYHTDALLGQLGSVAGGLLDGHVDGHRIVWIGHSLGGQAVIASYDALYSGKYQPAHFTKADIRLVSAIAPRINTWADAYPRDAVFHLLWGSHDTAVSGAPDCDHCQAFRYVDRAEGLRQSTYIHGAGHEDFDCCGSTWSPLGRYETQQVTKIIELALCRHYCADNVPAHDLLARPWDRLRPLGLAPSTSVISLYTAAPDSGKRVIDDYQSQFSPAISSSGGAVSFDVSNLCEDLLNDQDTSFEWVPSDPMNGMTYGELADTTRGVVFEWAPGPPRFLEFEILPDARDFTPFAYLSLRACQQTRHPETTAEWGDLTFTIALRDGAGVVSRINIGAYGGGIGDPYARTGAGAGVGWQNEFETLRLRLTDFLHNGSGLDLNNVAAVRLEFGGSFGSERGRLGLDDVELVR